MKRETSIKAFKLSLILPHRCFAICAVGVNLELNPTLRGSLYTTLFYSYGYLPVLPKGWPGRLERCMHARPLTYLGVA